jgi:hypothetical protein
MTEQIQRVCPSCGTSAGDFRFCPSCGHNLTAVSETARDATSTLADRPTAVATNGGEASTSARPEVSPIRSLSEYTPPAATTAAIRAIETPGQPDVSQDQSTSSAPENDSAPAASGFGFGRAMSENGHHRSPSAGASNDDVAAKPPETPRFKYAPAVVRDEADEPAEPVVASEAPAPLSEPEQPSLADERHAVAQPEPVSEPEPVPDPEPAPVSEPESPSVTALPLQDQDQPRPRYDAPRPAAAIPTAPESSSHRVAFVCLAAVIGLILLMLRRGHRANG